MRQEEAKYIGSVMVELSKDILGPILNLGSSTHNYRDISQPHINKYIFSPLMNSGMNVLHFDLKKQKGVDISGDLFDESIQTKLKGVNAAIIMLCNLLEHLEKGKMNAIPGIISKITPSNGIIIVTVPFSYPLHYDPIDTYFRPSPNELMDLFPDFEMISSDIITSTTYYQDLSKAGLKSVVRALFRLLIPFYRPKGWLTHAHRMSWLFRPYKVSCVVMKKSIKSEKA
jgi:hypothetical protein